MGMGRGCDARLADATLSVLGKVPSSAKHLFQKNLQQGSLVRGQPTAYKASLQKLLRGNACTKVTKTAQRVTVTMPEPV
jgi:hypothetical protein